MTLQVREVTKNELISVFKLESESYPEDEAASSDMLLYRHTEAPDLFVGGYVHGDIVGFVCATRYHGKELTHESMGTHIPNGESVCIHSVVVREDQRRNGIALEMLRAFIDKVKTGERDVARILLVCKANLIPLYTKAGFELVGKSALVHGKESWYALKISLTGS